MEKRICRRIKSGIRDVQKSFKIFSVLRRIQASKTREKQNVVTKNKNMITSTKAYYNFDYTT